MRRKFTLYIRKRVIGMSLACTLVAMAFSVNAKAYSDSEKAKLPGTNYHVQSNVWQSNTYFWETHSFKTSAKLYTSSSCTTTTKAKTIKTSFAFAPTGVGISCKGVSTGNVSGKGFSGSWENSNAWISDMSGTFKISGVPLYSTFQNSAFALKDGVKATAVAECFRFY